MKALKILGVNAAVLVALMVLIEVALQGVAFVRPSYETLFLQPDKGLGWKEVPNLHWTWGGSFWYASDFSVTAVANPLGFRDKTRETAKPDGVKRVALLGDSFIEAIQVPFEQTAGQLLDQQLNSAGTGKWEVLNFGVSNFGVGQYLLAWEQYAKNFHPDYVTIFVAKLHMLRTLDKYEYGAFSATADDALWVRPSFRVENGTLIREGARDVAKFEALQKGLIADQFGEDRSRRRVQWITPTYTKLITDRLRRLKSSLTGKSSGPKIDEDPKDDPDLFVINRMIIEELGRQVKATGGQFAIVDASRYFQDEPGVSDFLKSVAEANGFGYIPVSQDLLQANSQGITTRWPHDGHLNVVGNQILAKALGNWTK